MQFSNLLDNTNSHCRKLQPPAHRQKQRCLPIARVCRRRWRPPTTGTEYVIDGTTVHTTKPAHSMIEQCIAGADRAFCHGRRKIGS